MRCVLVLAAVLVAIPRPARPEAGGVLLVNLRTGERLEVAPFPLPPPAALNRFFRCGRDRRYTLMDPRLVLSLLDAAKRLSRRRVEVLSAFRTRGLNEALREAGHKVALRSRHVHGQALDIRLPGVPVTDLCAYFRRYPPGGVGCYHKQGFVHIDVGPVRFWSG
ncbi:MAG: YcbK family protein [Deltaproteobacteria bacterium]|nr:YcbK family protein [Deltaproteobacteria bacterium]